MEADALPPRWDEYARRLPSSLEDLKGPAAGKVELPLHVAWSGRRVYGLGEEDQRLVLYALLLAEAQRCAGEGRPGHPRGMGEACVVGMTGGESSIRNIGDRVGDGQSRKTDGPPRVFA